MEGGEESKPQLKGSLVSKPEGKLRGTLLQAADSKTSTKTAIGKEIDLSAHVSYLNEVVAPLAREHGGFGRVLGGSSPLSMQGDYDLDTSQFRRDPRNTYFLAPDLRDKTFARAWNTGADLNTLIRMSPDDRYKFYFSLDLSSPDRIKSAQEMFGKLLEMARKEKISLQSKSEDHTYDSLDLYTWDREKLEDVIKTLYSQYPNIWLTTHHFFQAPIDGVNPMHVGWVQEPIGGKNGSHSNRMGILGRTIDSSGKEIIDIELFKQVCKKASVNPYAPWLISETETGETLNDKLRAVMDPLQDVLLRAGLTGGMLQLHEKYHDVENTLHGVGTLSFWGSLEPTGIHKLLPNEPTAVIKNLWILEGLRKRGLGTKIVRTWEKVLSEKGVRVFATTNIRDKDAREFWGKMGYQALEERPGKTPYCMYKTVPVPTSVTV